MSKITKKEIQILTEYIQEIENLTSSLEIKKLCQALKSKLKEIGA